MDEREKNTAVPEGEADGEREKETAECAAGAGEEGREAEGKGVEEKGEAKIDSPEDTEPDSGTDPVAEEAPEEDAGNGENEAAEAETKDAEDGAAGKEEAAEHAEEAPAEEKNGFFRSRKELKKKDQEIAELKDQLLRARAEFDNFRKRTDKEKAVRFDDGAMFILQKLLPVVDNFERGLAQVPEEAKDDPYVTGLEKIYKQLTVMLEESGVKAIEAVGKEFDPTLHNAVMHVDDEELGENIVAEEFQKGYSYKDQVLRHSMVKVAN